MSIIKRLEDGDIYKILPTFNKDGSFDIIRRCAGFYINGRLFYDDDKYVKDFIKNNDSTKLLVKNFASVYVDGSIKYINFGKTILDIINNHIDKNSYTPSDDYYFKVTSGSVKTNYVPMLSAPVLPFTDHSKSHFIKIDLSPSDRLNLSNPNWIKSNQPSFDDYLSSLSILNNIKYLSSVTASGRLDRTISLIMDDRINSIIT